MTQLQAPASCKEAFVCCLVCVLKIDMDGDFEWEEGDGREDG